MFEGSLLTSTAQVFIRGIVGIYRKAKFAEHLHYIINNNKNDIKIYIFWTKNISWNSLAMFNGKTVQLNLDLPLFCLFFVFLNKKLEFRDPTWKQHEKK